ncbi:hypothetical protein [Methyloligella solikamskensis]|uniref:Uncharacterized protein n=1 Tax=Methyloligella solikamskensis TaxID=1177756 RepID=A0ABW3JC14_9HYPH
MAKGQQRSNREKKKPKQEKAKTTAAPIPSTIESRGKVVTGTKKK